MHAFFSKGIYKKVNTTDSAGIRTRLPDSILHVKHSYVSRTSLSSLTFQILRTLYAYIWRSSDACGVRKKIGRKMGAGCFKIFCAKVVFKLLSNLAIFFVQPTNCKNQNLIGYKYVNIFRNSIHDLRKIHESTF